MSVRQVYLSSVISRILNFNYVDENVGPSVTMFYVAQSTDHFYSNITIRENIPADKVLELSVFIRTKCMTG